MVEMVLLLLFNRDTSNVKLYVKIFDMFSMTFDISSILRVANFHAESSEAFRHEPLFLCPCELHVSINDKIRL